MIKLYNFDELKPEEILNRDIRAEKNVEDVVDAIIADVRARGDDALKDYALKFDGATIENLQVTQAEIDEAFAGMDPYFLETLRQAAENIEQFHRQQVHKNFVMNDRPGIVLGQKYTPIEKAGVYVPGGTAAYPSTTDPTDRWLAVRRFFDWDGNNFILTYFQKVDKPGNKRLIQSIVDSQNIIGNGYVARDYCAGYRLEFHAEENPITDLLDGKLTTHTYLAPYIPAEKIVNIREYDTAALEAALTGGGE